MATIYHQVGIKASKIDVLSALLVSLKDYVETGQEKPFPNDIQIMHFE
jgi:hypothetical protein